MCMHAKSPQSCLTLCDPMDVACQAPLSLGFSRQEYWSGLPCPPPGHLPDPGTESMSPALAGRFLTTSTIWEAQALNKSCLKKWANNPLEQGSPTSGI